MNNVSERGLTPRQARRFALACKNYVATIGDYVALTKPRVLSLLLLTTLAAMIISSGQIPQPGLILATLVGGAFMSGGANALNCYIERQKDKRMARTRLRPIPAGRIAPPAALLFSLALALIALLVFRIAVNALSAYLALAGFLVYVLVYTYWLKPSSAYGMLVGGIAGAIPPLVGWSAMTGTLNAGALLLFAIVVLWQAPHTLALSLMLKNDYARAKIPVMPLVIGEKETRRQIVSYTLLLIAASVLPTAFGITSFAYMVAALLLGTQFLKMAWNVYKSGERLATVRLYKFSLLYLALLFLLMVIDRVGVTIFH